MFDDTLPPRKRKLIPYKQVKYVQYIVVSRDTEKLEMVRKEVIQVISDIF